MVYNTSVSMVIGVTMSWSSTPGPTSPEEPGPVIPSVSRRMEKQKRRVSRVVIFWADLRTPVETKGTTSRWIGVFPRKECDWKSMRGRYFGVVSMVTVRVPKLRGSPESVVSHLRLGRMSY